MSKSLFLTAEQQHIMLSNMDAILVGKAMYDEGYPLPDHLEFYHIDDASSEDYFSYAIAHLFDADHFDTDDGEVFKFAVSEIQEWQSLKAKYPEMSKDEEFFLEPVKELMTSYVYCPVECRLSGNGFIIAMECSGFGYFELIKNYTKFKKRFDDKLDEWRGFDGNVAFNKAE